MSISSSTVTEQLLANPAAAVRWFSSSFTTIRLLMNALRPDGGTARVLGVDVSSPEFRAVKEDVGVVLDEAYYPESCCSRIRSRFFSATKQPFPATV